MTSYILLQGVFLSFIAPTGVTCMYEEVLKILDSGRSDFHLIKLGAH